MQIPLVYINSIEDYRQARHRPSWKHWSGPCPLCGAKNCAAYLCSYTRKEVYCLDDVSRDIPVARFICNRRDRDDPEGTHRTFSLLPIFLFPYLRSSVDLIVAIAEELAQNDGNVYRTSDRITTKYRGAKDFNAASIARIKKHLHKTMDKLHHLHSSIHKAIGWSTDKNRLSDLMTLIRDYQCRLSEALRGARALSYDWFHLIHKHLRHMERDFFVGTASQFRLKSTCW